MSRKIDLVFAACFAVFFIGWLTFDLPVALGLIYKGTGWYAREIDPIFRDPPSWLRTIGWFAFAYGPFYLLTAYGFFRSRPWLPYVLLPLAGMVVTSTAIYMIEDATGGVPPSNWAVFFFLNGPYVLVPVLAAAYLIVRDRATVVDGTSASV